MIAKLGLIFLPKATPINNNKQSYSVTFICKVKIIKEEDCQNYLTVLKGGEII